MRCPKHLRDCSNKQQYHSVCLPLQFYSFLSSTMVSMYLRTTPSPKEELLQVYVRARAIARPIFQCFVCLCEIVPTNCQSSCTSKHSYMHNRASYMFMHLIKLSCYPYASTFSIPMIISIKINHVNFKFLLLTTNVYCRVNFKVQQSCQHSFQIQAPAVMSIKFSSFSNNNLFLLTAKWLVRVQEQLVPVNSLLLSVKQQVRIREQLVPVNLFLFPVK